MAVEYVNGETITDNYTIQNLSELTRSKNNNKVTGLKKSGHTINSVEIPILEVPAAGEADVGISTYLQELLISFNKSDQKSDLYTEEDVTTEFTNLSNIFLDSDFKMEMLRSLFDDDAWVAVQDLIKLKVANSTCADCKLVCITKCLRCEKCKRAFHLACQSVSKYISSGKGKKPWTCSYCKAKEPSTE
jgi:hypothetical protein